MKQKKRMRVLAFLLCLSMVLTPMANVNAETVSAETVGTEVSVEPLQLASGTTSWDATISEDFEGAEVGTWGMTGGFTPAVATDADGNNYLAANGTKYGTKTAVKTLDVPDMSTANISYKWYTTSLTSDSKNGRPGFTLKGGGVEIVSVLVGEMRSSGAATPVYYSTYNPAGDPVVTQSSVTVTSGATCNVNIAMDFTAHTAVVTIDGAEVVSLKINEAITKVDEFGFNMYSTMGSGKTYTVNMGLDDFALSYNEPGGTITEDFEGAEVGAWGMTGGFTPAVATDADGNNYLAANGTKYGTKTAVKTFEVPDMKTANISYKWYPTSLTSDSKNGRPGFTLKGGGVEIVSVLVGEMRSSGAATPVYYSTYNPDGDPVVTQSSVTVTSGATCNVNIAMDFLAHTAVVTIDGAEVVSLKINEAITKVDEFGFNMYSTMGSGKTYTVNMGLDDFNLTYKTNTSAVVKPQIASLAALDSKTVTKAEWEGDYQHPQTVVATLKDETTKELAIDQTSWTSTPATINVNEMGTYTWTANVVLEDGMTNPLGLKVEYTMNYKSDFLDTDINSLNVLSAVTVTKEQWDAGYEHPAKVNAVLVNKSAIEAEIDQTSWTCVPAFDPAVRGKYIWTANLAESETNRNHRGLTVSYQMNYQADFVSEHDFEDDFTFSAWDTVAWGKGYEVTSGTGSLALSQKEDADGNAYQFVSGLNQGGGRGTRKDFSTEIVKGATISLDWMPVTATPDGVASGNLDFFSTANNQNYFTLRYDTDFVIDYFTKGEYNNTTVQPEFEGAIAEDARVSTGLGAQNTWFTVKLDFDYIAHTADLTITEKANPANTYSATDIPIEGSANGLCAMIMRLDRYSNSRSGVEMGIDNVVLDYNRFDGNDIVDITNPANVNVAKDAYDSFLFPTEVAVQMGDGTTKVIPVGEWTAEPVFDKETAAVYTWTAPLVTGEYTNYFNLKAQFTMDYTMYAYPTYAHNPSTLELEFGEALPEFPTTVVAAMSDGTINNSMPIGEWEAIRAFDAEKEGIYVYGAYLKDVEGEIVVNRDKLAKNEYHVNGEDKEKYVYDVYYRVNYFKSQDNYNAYERSMEYLDRGVYAVKSGNGVLVSWRLLASEYGKDYKFYVYRNGICITDAITDKTNYLDAAGKPGDEYHVKTTCVEGDKTLYWMSEGYTATEENYMSIPLQNPGSMADKDGNINTYSINDSSVADVDGDGQYEVIVKWYPSDAFDSGKQNGPSAPTIFDVYEMDGTPLWRLNMGLECPSGAHWNQFMLYDLDEDGKAELFIKTSDGTTSYKPNAEGKFDMLDESTIVSYVGDKSVVPGTNINSTGHANEKSNEYMTVFNGQTGEVIDSINYIYENVKFGDYGDDWGNRASRYNIAIAYQPKSAGSTETIPAVLFNHGYYAKTTVASYTLRDGKLQLEWGFDSSDYPDKPYTSKGNHNVATGDIDNDGFDELIIGALALDHDGKVLWVKDGNEGRDYAGHADAISLAAMNPNDPTQLYVMTPAEDTGSTLNGTLSNASNGGRINGTWSKAADIGRGIAANITPDAGFEYWASNPNSEGTPNGGIFNIFGGIVSATKPSNFTTNWIAYWDGDLLSELPDAADPAVAEDALTVYKYNWETNEMDVLQSMGGTKLNNSTKNNPSLTADLFGDWREEIMVRNADNTELRIYMTNFETDYMIYSLMQDPVYRNAVANQNTAYNQPPHVGFYLGNDNEEQVLAMALPTANISYTTAAPAGTVAEVEQEPPADEEIDEVTPEVSTGDASITEDVLTEDLKAATDCETTEELVDLMKDEAIAALKDKTSVTTSVSNTYVADVTVYLTMANNGAQVEATADNFPAEGVSVVIPFPAGMTYAQAQAMNFSVVQLVTEDCNGNQAGDVLTESYVLTENGIVVNAKTPSPFAIAWTEKPLDSDGGNQDDTDDSAGSSVVTGATKTGDNMDTMMIVWLIVLLAAASVAGFLGVRIYRQKKETKE